MDTNTVSTPLPVTTKDLTLNSLNEEYEVSHAYTREHDEAPDSPCTLLGEDVDLDEVCSPLALDSSRGYFIAETPPGSPSTLFGDSNDLEEIKSPSPSGTSNRICDAEDEPGSPSTILGDYTENEAQTFPAKASSRGIFTKNLDDRHHPHSPSTTFGNKVGLEAVNTVPLNLGLPSPENYRDESGGDDDFINFLQSAASQDQSAQASRCCMQQPCFICDAVRLIDGRPDVIIKAFVDGNWNFRVDEEDRTVLEAISRRKSSRSGSLKRANNCDLPDM